MVDISDLCEIQKKRKTKSQLEDIWIRYSSSAVPEFKFPSNGKIMHRRLRGQK
jgi:hypothetical protein